MPTHVCLLRCDVLYFLRSSIFCGTVCYFTNGTVYSSCVCDDKQCLHVNLSLWLLRESLWMLPSHVTFDGVLLTCYIAGFCIHMTTARYYCVKLLLGNWDGTLLVFITWCLYHMISSHQFINVNLRRSSPLLIYMNWCLYQVTLSRQFIIGKFTQPFALFMYMMPVPSDIVASIYLWKIYAAFCFVYVHDASTQWHCRVYLSLEKLRGPSSLCIYMMSVSWDIFASDYHWEIHVVFLLY